MDPHTQIVVAGASVVLLIGVIFAFRFRSSVAKLEEEENLTVFGSFLRFFYASFLKPHTGDGTLNGQQDALESFYKAQASVYDTTRRTLLRGREDMLGLVAAQLVQKAARERTHDPKRIWVDVSVEISPPTWLPANDLLADWRRYRLEHRSHVRIRRCRRLLLQRLPSRLLSLPLRSSSETICTFGMEECQGCLPGCKDLPS